MRPALTLLSGLTLSAVLTSAALATAEPERTEAGDDSRSAVSAPVSGTTGAVSAEEAPEVTGPATAAIEPRDAVDDEAVGLSPASDSPESDSGEPATSESASEAEDLEAGSEPAGVALEPDTDDPAASVEAVADPGLDPSPEQEAANSEPQKASTPEAAAVDPLSDESASPAEAAEIGSEEAAPEQETASEQVPSSTPEAAEAVEQSTDDPAQSEAAEADLEDVGSEQPSTASGPEATSSSDTAAVAEPLPVVSKFEPEVLRLIVEAEGLKDEERDALTAFYEGRGDDLLWIEDGAFNTRAEAAMAEIQRADDWGLEASAFELPSPPQSDDPAEIARAELKLSLAVLKYANHARGGRINPRQLSNYIDREPPLLPPSDVLAGIAQADAVDAYLRGLHPQHPQFEKLRQAYLDIKRNRLPVEDAEADVAPKGKAGKAKGGNKTTDEAKLRKILHNMEQWRWMPEDLGRFYVWANVPEFTLRVVHKGETIHSERLIVGKPDTQTPIFSDEMETIVFHPFWGVPNSIKVKEILPGLIRGGNILERNNLRIQYRGRDIDPARVDWRRTDIRNFHVYQPPGPSNVLGVVKFLFPNKHAVYMHDTPSKHLFANSQRMFSHGCVRVRDPLKFAEILLAYDKGWDRSRVDWVVKRGPRDNHIKLDNKIPVHITYFTAWVDDDGKLKTASDVYGHEKLIQMGLEGKAHLIARKKEDLGAVQAEVVSRLAETQPTWTSPSSSRQPDWVRRVFGH
jgi:murein L,D-transpeptidase YcbB/YkuD